MTKQRKVFLEVFINKEHVSLDDIIKRLNELIENGEIENCIAKLETVIQERESNESL